MAGRAGGSVFFLTDYGLADEFAGVVRAVGAAPRARRPDHRPDPRRRRRSTSGRVRWRWCAPCRTSVPASCWPSSTPASGPPRRAVAVSVGPAPATVGRDRTISWAPTTVCCRGRSTSLGGVRTRRGAPRSRRRRDDGRRPSTVATSSRRPRPACGRAPPLDRPRGRARPRPAWCGSRRPALSVSPGALEAEVQWVDRFGNVQLAAGPDDAAAAALGDELEVLAPATAPSGPAGDGVRRARSRRAGPDRRRQRPPRPRV